MPSAACWKGIASGRTKIHSLLKILEDEDCDPDGVATIDQFLAETLDGRDPIKALIGYSPDLGSALLGLLATLNGKLDDRLPFTPVLMDLSNALARWRLPEVEAALLRRVQAGLDGHHPLSRDGSRVLRHRLPPHRRLSRLLQRLSRRSGNECGADAPGQDGVTLR